MGAANDETLKGMYSALANVYEKEEKGKAEIGAILSGESSKETAVDTLAAIRDGIERLVNLFGG